MRAAGVPGRGEKGKTWRKVSPHSSTIDSELLEHRLGLGREAGDEVGAEDDVGPEPPHRRRRSASASAREMPPLHALQDQVVAATAARDGDAASAAPPRRSRASASSSASIESIEERRRRSQLRHVLQDRAHQPAEARRAGQVGAIGGDVDAGQHDLAIAVLDEARGSARRPRPSAPSANCRGRRG